MRLEVSERDVVIELLNNYIRIVFRAYRDFIEKQKRLEGLILNQRRTDRLNSRTDRLYRGLV